MKKSLILIPLAAMVLAGCTVGKSSGKKKKSTSATDTAQTSGSKTNTNTSTTGGSGSGRGDTTVVPPGPSLPTEHEASFAPNMTPGEHTITFDFDANYTTYKPAFPYVSADTGLVGIYLDGMAIMTNGCWASQGYNGGANYLMMKNKDGFADANGASFIGNCVALGTISKVEITRGASASTSQRYYVTFGSSLDTAPASSGTELEGTGDSATNATSGMTFFKVTTKDKAKNGQLQNLKVTYTV